MGSGRNRQVTILLEVSLTDGSADYALDISALDGLDGSGTYAAVISSDSYADVQVAFPTSDGQRAALESLIGTANEKLAAHILLLTAPRALRGDSAYRLTVFVYGASS